MRKLARRSLKAGAGLAGLVVLALLAGAFLSRSLPDLELWHIEAPGPEFRARDAEEVATFEGYLALERALFEDLRRFEVEANAESGFSPVLRYARGGVNNPRRFPVNWNRTRELIPAEARGGILLLHGLTDSPYSLRAVGEVFRERGFHVLLLRLPGHGTTPSALAEARWGDWCAAVRLAAARVRERAGDGPFFVGGYSNGAALALEYATGRLLEGKECPDALVLFSPAIGVSGFARISDWHHLFSWIPWFRKSRWLDVLPEIDPYKYSSFPKDAGGQIWALTRRVHANLDRLRTEGRIDDLPPVLTFQSLVDATVRGRDTVDRLYARLTTPDSELVLFDVVRTAEIVRLLRREPDRQLAELLEAESLAYRLTLITNRVGDLSILERSRAPGEEGIREMPTGLSWPNDIFSLSHVAIPFRPDDPIYGDGSGDVPELPVRLGHIALRGERHLLLLPSDIHVRLRYNPCFPYVEKRLREWIDRFLAR